MLGGAIAAFVYWFFIEAHHSKVENDSDSEQDLTPTKKTESDRDAEKDIPL